MPIFRVTKKLATVLKVKLPKEPVEIANPEHEWFADLFYVEGKKCVVWVHRTTLLMFVRPAVVAAELKLFPALFRFEFGALMASMALPESLLDRFGGHGLVSYAPTNDRAIVGSMLDGRKMFALIVDLDDGLQHADVRGINAQLNEVPMSVLGMESAVDVVRRFVARHDELLLKSSKVGLRPPHVLGRRWRTESSSPTPRLESYRKIGLQANWKTRLEPRNVV